MVLVRLLTVLTLVAAGCGDDDPVVHPDATPPPDAPPPPPDAALPDGPPPPPGTGCNVPIDLTDEPAPTMHNTQFSADATGASCAGGTTGAPEFYFDYDAGASPVDVVIDVTVDESVAAPFDVVLSARTACVDAASEVACVDVGWGEHLEVLAVTGVVSILVDGSGEFGGLSAGEFTISVTTRAIAGVGDTCDPAGVTSRCDTDLLCSGGMCEATSPTLACLAAVDLTADLAADGVAQTSANLLLTDPDYYQASCAFDVSANYPERIYRIDLAAPGTLVASTDNPATTYDTVLSLKLDACDAAEVACTDDVDAAAMNYRSNLDTHLVPGTYYLFVDTSSGFLYGTPGMTPHTYQLDVTFTPD